MDEKIEYWSRRYKLDNLKLAGYQGGYPMIMFDVDSNRPILYQSQREINKALRSAETYGGIELGVGYSLRKTSFLRIENETIVICGHEFVIERILEKLFSL